MRRGPGELALRLGRDLGLTTPEESDGSDTLAKTVTCRPLHPQLPHRGLPSGTPRQSADYRVAPATVASERTGPPPAPPEGTWIGGSEARAPREAEAARGTDAALRTCSPRAQVRPQVRRGRCGVEVGV